MLELSVVMPTYNRVKIVERTLTSLCAQSVGRDQVELLVIDDGSTDGAMELLRHFKSKCPFDLRLFTQDHQLAGTARNVGIREARSECVLLLDNDLEVKPDFLSRHMEFHRRYPEVTVGVLGRVITGDTGMNLLDPDDRQIQPCGTTPEGDPVVDVGCFKSGNVSLKREFLLKAGMFTPGMPCLQDLDVAFSLDRQGLTLLYAADAEALHLQPLDTVEKVIRSGLKYGRGLAEWYDRRPLLRQEMVRLGARFSGGWRYAIEHPLPAVKDGVRRWSINAMTIGLIERLALKLSACHSSQRVLARCCREIWAYHYRHEFCQRRREMACELAAGRSE